jgi:pyrimidine-specific ribonucleoside hydrolase
MISLLIDTDPGIDDALALLYAWNSVDAAVEAITTVAGNVSVDRGTLNVFRLLALRRPARLPPVAVGAAQPLGRSLQTAERHHGGDGLGDLDDWPPVDAKPIGEPAEAVIVAMAKRLGRRLTLVALGPLTNLARAIHADGPALARVGRLVAMGGAVDVPGNVTPDAEFNMHVDPEAAKAVFDYGLPLDLVPLDATRQARLARRDLEDALANRPALLATRILAFTRSAFRSDGAMYLHDPLAVGVALDPTLVEWERIRLEVSQDGATRRAPGAPNCRVARRVDHARFLATFLERLCPESS